MRQVSRNSAPPATQECSRDARAAASQVGVAQCHFAGPGERHHPCEKAVAPWARPCGVRRSALDAPPRTVRTMTARVAGRGIAAQSLALLLLLTCSQDHLPTSPTALRPPSIVSLTANAAAASSTLLVGAGNIARCDRTNDEATGQLLDNYPTATVFTTGDNTNGNASLNDFNTCYGPSWGRNKARTRPAVGDQDYKTAGAAGFFQYFGTAGGDSGKYYYSYDLGAWHIMVLNDNISMTAGSPQEQWLRTELQANTKQCTLAYWHHPRFSSTGQNNLASVKPLWDALYDWHADVVVNAHFDVYERFAPQTPAGAADPATGLREFIVGTGGQNLQKPGSPKPNSQVRNGTTYGVLKLALDTAAYSWEFVPVAGQTFSDTGTTACHTHVAVASVDVSPTSAAIHPSGTVQLTATPKDAAGNPLSGRVVTWASGDTTIAKVDANGLVTGKTPGGPVTITATSEGKSGTSAVTVTPVPVASVVVTPATGSTHVGVTLQLTATPKDSAGNPLTGRTVTWASGDTTIAKVDASGLVTGKTLGGPVTVTATSEGKSGTSAVTVTPVPVASVDVSPPTATIQVGATLQLTATPKDSAGNPLNGRTVTWQTGDATVATVDANGLVTGKGKGGPVTITATSESKSGTSAVTVTAVPVASVDVTPASASVQAGATVQLTATPKDSAGNPLSGRVVTWASGDTTIAKVDASGLVSGKAVGGPVTITATSEGKSGSSGVTVTAVPVASVDVSPPNATVLAGTTLQLTGTPKDANGNPLTGRTVTWQTSDATVADVDANGLVTGKAVGGPVTITATSEGKNGTSAITVSLVPVASVDVTPATGSVEVGKTLQLTATPKDSAGNPLSGRVVTWASADTTIAKVSATGLVTGKAAGGPATITATSEGKNGTATVTVTPVPVAAVEVSPAAATIQVNGTVQLTATPKDANGNPLGGRVVTWASSAPAIASVNSTGFVVGLAAGTANVTATSEGAVGTSVITVQSPTGPPVFAGAGDIAECPRTSQEATAKLLDAISGTVYTLGDNAYPDGSTTDYTNCYDPSWGRHKARTRPSAGNHEYNTAGAAGYFTYFGAAAGDPSKGYYSYDLGDWHIVVVNSSNGEPIAGSAQEQWLRADLAANPKTCTLAYWHHPLFSSGPKADTLMRAAWQALYDYNADLVVNGHEHFYERFAPQTPGGTANATNGIREFIVGTGGNGFDLFGTTAANSEVRNNTTYGVLKLTLWATSYDWEFVPVAGGTFSDKGSGVCHSGGPIPNQAPTANPGGPYASEGPVTVDGSGSRDPDNNVPLSYAWDFGDGTSGGGVTATHTYAADGTYVVTLTVTDAKGLASAPATTVATIANVAPTVNAGPDQSTLPGATLKVQARFSDPGANDFPWSYAIAWGDGATTNGTKMDQTSAITESHVYAAPGQYTTRVTVTDKDGGAGWDELLVKVLDPATAQVFVGAGNITSCGTDRDEASAKLLDNISGTVFTTGDGANPSGTATTYASCYDPTWGRHRARTYPTPGNHDYDVTGATGYFGYYGAAAGDPSKGYYSFDLGNWHIIVLNNAGSAVPYGAGSAQEQWLKVDLAASTKQCTLAMFHYPRFFSSSIAGWLSSSGPKPFWDDLYAANADVVLNGQQYDYERFAPQDPDGFRDDARGIREFNAGTGGYANGAAAYIAPNTEAISTDYGVLKLTLGPDSYVWEFIPIPGYSFTDSGSGNCH